jgi:hypothetical protein
MNRVISIAFTALAVIALLPLPTARATPNLQRKASEGGFPATGCRYCHTFDTDHMRERARKMGIPSGNCGACHGKNLPKSGLALMNARGQWLLVEKQRRKAGAVDVQWLKDYVEPSPKAPARR